METIKNIAGLVYDAGRVFFALPMAFARMCARGHA